MSIPPAYDSPKTSPLTSSSTPLSAHSPPPASPARAIRLCVALLLLLALRRPSTQLAHAALLLLALLRPCLPPPSRRAPLPVSPTSSTSPRHRAPLCRAPPHHLPPPPRCLLRLALLHPRPSSTQPSSVRALPSARALPSSARALPSSARALPSSARALPSTCVARHAPPPPDVALLFLALAARPRSSPTPPCSARACRLLRATCPPVSRLLHTALHVACVRPRRPPPPPRPLPRASPASTRVTLLDVSPSTSPSSASASALSQGYSTTC
ncbi:uncharacterized protein BXZ73DRAFT_78987 [Epithele typhae]|uniref:uncharacterized protein n=1 Tax=Epithele typhae TaxID=378194 RepID=UPI002007D87F|nr:uncharacterized protein BXZ73DRAFT_78987 [Epithele typhae]KAH9925661.1 hypothetical protein BXZ73DRAFT_78987 [Epithele typhae]